LGRLSQNCRYAPFFLGADKSPVLQQVPFPSTAIFDAKGRVPPGAQAPMGGEDPGRHSSAAPLAAPHVTPGKNLYCFLQLQAGNRKKMEAFRPSDRPGPTSILLPLRRTPRGYPHREQTRVQITPVSLTAPLILTHISIQGAWKVQEQFSSKETFRHWFF